MYQVSSPAWVDYRRFAKTSKLILAGAQSTFKAFEPKQVPPQSSSMTYHLAIKAKT